MTTRIGIDTETTGLNIWTGDKPFCVSMFDEYGKDYYWEWEVNPFTREPIVKRKDRRQIKQICESSKWDKDFFNLKFDMNMLWKIGIELKPPYNEVSYMAKCVNSLEFKYALKPLAKKYIGLEDDDEKYLKGMVIKARACGKKLKWNRHADLKADYWMIHNLYLLNREMYEAKGLDRKANKEYAIRDAERTIYLGEYYRAGMEDHGTRHIYDFEMKLFPTTLEMERYGVRIDPKRMRKLSKECRSIKDKAYKSLQKQSGRDDFNPNSPDQIIKLLFHGEPLNLPVLKRNKPTKKYPKGSPKTDAEALIKHKKNPIVENIFRFRANDKALNTFFDKYKHLAVRDDTGLILHPGYRQWGTLTGRYSCTEPNLQQVGSPDTTSSRMAEYMVNVREIFIPRKQCVWFAPDYSQVEVIIFAAITGEESLLTAIRNGEDIHTATTEKVYGGKNNERALIAAMKTLGTENENKAHDALVKYNYRITDLEDAYGKKLHRKLAKGTTFTKIFGGGPKALMAWVGVDYDEACSILDAYDSAFPDMQRKMDDIIYKAKCDGYIYNAFGKRLSIDPWYTYRAVNYVVQSSAADLNKRGMYKCNKYLKEIGFGKLIMTIHDENIFEFRKGEVFKSVLKKICELMSDHGGVFSVDTPVDMDVIRARWSKKEKYIL